MYPFRVAPFLFLIVCFNRTHAKACKSEDDDDGDMKWRNMILMMNILRPEKSASQFFWQNSIEGIKWIRSDGFWWWITKWVLYSGSMKLFPAKIAERATLQNLWRQRVTVHCYPRLLTDERRYRQEFPANSKSLRISSYITTLESRISMFPSASQEARLTVSLESSHCVNCFMYCS